MGDLDNFGDFDIRIADAAGNYMAGVDSTGRLKTDALVSGTAINYNDFKTKTAVYIGEQTNTNALTPTTGKKLVIVSTLIQSSITSAVAWIKLNFAASVIPINYFYANQGKVSLLVEQRIKGATNESVTLNTNGATASDQTFILINYVEVD